MRKFYFLFFWGIFFGFFHSQQSYATSISVLNGNTYKTYSEEQYQKEIITIEQFGTWKYGTVFFFWDISRGFRKDDQSDFYGSIAPALSFSKVSGRDISYGLLKDISFKVELEEVSGLSPVYFYGLSFDFLFWELDYFTVQTVVRDDPVKSGSGGQLNISWKKRFSLGPYLPFSFNGFLSAGVLPESKDEFFMVTQPQLLWDLGAVAWNAPQSCELGIEYAFAKNRFLKAGTRDSVTGEKFEGFDETVLQAMIKFSYQGF